MATTKAKPKAKPKRKLGRRSLLTPEVQEKLITALKSGNYRDAAATYAGISRPTFYTWMARGEEEGTGPYAEFRAAVLAAEETGEAQMVMLWRAQMGSDWRAICAFLERRYPARWARREIITHDETLARGGHGVEELIRNPKAMDAYHDLLTALAENPGADPRGSRDPSY